MPATRPVPNQGSYYVDARGADRALRVSWHLEDAVEEGLVVLSLWRGNLCTGSFRLALDDVADLVGLLNRGLGEALTRARLTG